MEDRSPPSLLRCGPTSMDLQGERAWGGLGGVPPLPAPVRLRPPLAGGGLEGRGGPLFLMRPQGVTRAYRGSQGGPGLLASTHRGGLRAPHRNSQGVLLRLLTKAHREDPDSSEGRTGGSPCPHRGSQKSSGLFAGAHTGASGLFAEAHRAAPDSSQGLTGELPDS